METKIKDFAHHIIITLFISTLVHGVLAMPGVVEAMPQTLPVTMPVATPTETPQQTMPAAATPAATSTPATMPSALTAVPTTPAEKSAVSAESYKKELEQIMSDMKKINELKATLNDQRKLIDDKIQEAHSVARDAKKTSFDILSKTTEPDAQANADKVAEGLKSVKAIQDSVQGELGKNFESSLAKLQSLMDTLQGSIKALQAKGVSLQIMQAQREAAQEIAQIKEEQITKKEHVRTKEKPSNFDSVIHYVFDKIADLISGTYGIVTTTFTNIKNYFWPTSKAPTITSDEVKKKARESVNQSTDQQKSPGQTAQGVNADQVKAQVAEYDQVIKQLDANKQALDQKIQSLEKTTQELGEKNPELKSLLNEVPHKPSITKDAPWKKTTIGILGKFLDFAGLAVDYVVYYAQLVYRDYIAPLISKVTRDVQDKTEASKTEQKKARADMQPKMPSAPEKNPVSPAPTPAIPAAQAPTPVTPATSTQPVSLPQTSQQQDPAMGMPMS